MRLVFITVFGYLNFSKVIRHTNQILFSELFSLPPGIVVDFNGKRFKVPDYSKAECHLNYPSDGNVHQTLRCYNKKNQMVKVVNEDLEAGKYRMKTYANNIKTGEKIYTSNEVFEDKIFISAGAKKGPPLSEYALMEIAFNLSNIGFTVGDGFTMSRLISFRKKK